MTETALPGAYSFGKVIARMIAAVGDISAAGDPYPDSVPVSAPAAVTFIPSAPTRVVPGSGSSILVKQAPVTADLDADGYLSLNGSQGVWLYTGQWTVKFAPQFNINPFNITVTTSHTDLAPLDLFSVIAP